MNAPAPPHLSSSSQATPTAVLSDVLWSPAVIESDNELLDSLISDEDDVSYLTNISVALVFIIIINV